MFSRRLAGALTAVCLVAWPAAARAGDDATLLRVFLNDGTALISYGEFARIGDQVVFSMPTAATPNPPLHLVNLAADRVDWNRTNRYAEAARADHYLETRADLDYAALSNEIAGAMNEVSTSKDNVRRLSMAESARKTLAEWPQNHFNYRSADVRQMLGMLDEAIADLRAAAGGQKFELALTTFADPPAIIEPLLPPPTPKEAIEEILSAARIVESSSERTALLSTALASLDRDAGSLPADWVSSVRSETSAAVQAELTIDRTYQAFARRYIALATRRARYADVRGVERLIVLARQRDRALGSKRPDNVNALVAAVEAQLDAARQLRLARDRWALRAPALRAYRTAIQAPMNLFARLNTPLQSIKSLSGTSPTALQRIERTVEQILRQASAVAPPDELRQAHALLISAVQLAGHAGQIRREATLAADVTRAWDASSAAAGALLLGDRAKSDIQTLVRPPQLP